MTNDDPFADDFRHLTGRSPYAWQRRLYLAMLAGELPSALDLPTGLGKTSVLAIWLLARAAGAPVPRRLFYVVDRRAVVDQASAEAERIAKRLSDGSDASTRLCAALALGSDGLPVSTLRGQLADNRAWLQRPDNVAIVVGTVDMVGSRLLFSGYGVSRRMRPVHAALIGSDSLVVLDEAHLVPPFEALLKAASALAATFQRQAPLPVAPLRLMSLSATALTHDGRRFTLTDADKADAAVAARLSAPKRLKLHLPVAIEALAETLAAFAVHRAGTEAAVAVFCNSRKMAQAVGRQLKEAVKKDFGTTSRVAMLVGERRVYERTAFAASDVFARFSPARHPADATPSPLPGPAFLVATSAGEVGVDLDADHLVCDLVTWERMVQRLGRVNRRPLPAEAWVDVFPALQKPDKEIEQPVTDLDCLAAPFNSTAWPRDDDQRLDASPGALLTLRDAPGFAPLAEDATRESPLHPALTLAHLQAWAMTSLDRHPGRTKVGPWLRGWVDAEPECRVVWRRCLPLRAPAGMVPFEVDGAFLLACPPHLSETLEAPAWRVAETLKARAKAMRKGDVDAKSAGSPRPMGVVVLDADLGVSALFDIQRLADFDAKKLAYLLAERSVIVDARFGGLDEQGLLDSKASAVPHTLDDGGEWQPTLDAIGFRVRVPSATDDENDDDATGDRVWQIQAKWAAEEDADQPDLIVEVLRKQRSDEGDPALARWAQRLGEHQAWAGRHAAAIAAALGIGEEAARMIELAAAHHDEGKRRAEWQMAIGMRQDGGDAWAKSGERRPVDKRSGRRDGRANPALMAGYRHEFGSVHDVATVADRLPAAWRDLFLHVIAAHHGHARPTINPHDPAHPPSVTADQAQQVALRYARLEAQWGPWALAWWETVLQAADWQASAELNAGTTREGNHV